MTKNINYVSHKKSKVKNNGKPQLPSANSLVEGEIAINYAKDVETLSIKNESGTVVTFSSDNYYTEKKLCSSFTESNCAVTVTDAIFEVERAISAESTRAQAAESNRYTKSETYTKSEVNGLVDTPHQNYVTVATYSALPATGSTDTIYRVSNWDGSANNGAGAVDVTVYSEYAWDGTQYIFLCVKSQIGEVFDITVYNNNAKYDTLADALGVNGANVPQSIRRGGMSVKYVQNSDNKYVQYRYMETDATTAATFTNVANWQGVDDEPTVGSKNLVKSGGVEIITNIIGDIVNLEKRFSLLSNADTNSNDTYNWIILSGSGLYRVYGVSGEEAFSLRKNNATGTYVRTASIFTYGNEYYLFITDKDIEDGATHARISKRDGFDAKYFKHVDLYRGFAYPSASLNNIIRGCFYFAAIAGVYPNAGNIEVKEGELAFLYYNGTTWAKRLIGLDDNLISFDKSGAIRTSDGVPISNSNYIRTDYIRVDEGDSLIYYGYTARDYAKIVCYDSSKTPIQVLLATSGDAYGNVVTMPEGTAYVMCSSVDPSHNSYFAPKAKILYRGIDLKKFISDTNEGIAELEENVAGIMADVVNNTTITEATAKSTTNGGHFKIGTDGTATSNNSFTSTLFIPVTTNDTIVYTGYANTTSLCVAGYSSDDESHFVKGLKKGTASQLTNLEIPVPDGISYIRCCFMSGNNYQKALTIRTKLSVSEKVSDIETEISDIKTDIQDIQNSMPISFNGKRIAVIGDSISTGLRMNGYITIKSVDVGNEIQSYVTYYDVYTAGGDATGKTIGGVALTSAMIGTLQTFTPVEADIDKAIGVGIHYYSNNQGWAYKLCSKLGATLINASWSGASLTSGQGEGTDTEALKKKLSHGWSDLTIGRCRIRDDEGNYLNPDVVIIYRGTNDFSHSPYARLDSDYDLAANGYPVTDLYDTNKYGFYRAYYLTIAKIREAYPNAVIYCCTLNTFKRMTHDRFPVRQPTAGAPGYSVLDYNKAIRDIANTMSCGLIEFDKDGITFENCYPTYISDSADIPTHPNETGQLVMANRALMDMRYLIQIS